MVSVGFENERSRLIDLNQCSASVAHDLLTGLREGERRERGREREREREEWMGEKEIVEIWRERKRENAGERGQRVREKERAQGRESGREG